MVIDENRICPYFLSFKLAYQRENQVCTELNAEPLEKLEHCTRPCCCVMCMYAYGLVYPVRMCVLTRESAWVH
jgi:hypothetical protein